MSSKRRGAVYWRIYVDAANPFSISAPRTSAIDVAKGSAESVLGLFRLKKDLRRQRGISLRSKIYMAAVFRRYAHGLLVSGQSKEKFYSLEI